MKRLDSDDRRLGARRPDARAPGLKPAEPTKVEKTCATKMVVDSPELITSNGEASGSATAGVMILTASGGKTENVAGSLEPTTELG